MFVISLILRRGAGARAVGATVNAIAGVTATAAPVYISNFVIRFFLKTFVNPSHMFTFLL